MNFIKKPCHGPLPILLALLLLASCHNHPEGEQARQHGESDQHEHGAGNHEDHHEHDRGEEHAEGEVHLSKEQVKAMKITFGDFADMKINDYVSATGTLGLPPNAYSAVSAKAAGFIKGSQKYVEGSYIKKGALIAYLENPEFIKQQQQYLELGAELAFLNQELARQQKLVAANAGIAKKVEQLQSEVNVKTATQSGLSRQLAYLGINASGISADNILDRIAVFSPMSGYISSINLHNGMYVTPQQELMEVVSETHLHLELDVFEKDVAQVKEGQKISYVLPALGNTVYEGEVHVLGKEFNPENKTVRIHGHLEKERPRFLKDLFVEAKIWLNDETVRALPDGALVDESGVKYIFAAIPPQPGDGEVKFERIMVNTGISDKGFTAVTPIDQLPDGSKIVTEGAYFVQAQSKVGELTHEH